MSDKLDIVEFGKHLLDSGDLDPVYIMLAKAEMPQDQLKRWLVAYWCFYHCGVASFMSDYSGNDFWKYMNIAAENVEATPIGGRWPRGHERRHFRGDNARKGLESLCEKYVQPEEFVDYIVNSAETGEIELVSKAVREHYAFGPWMAFKVADMVDRVLGVPVDFTQASVFMFDDPVEAAIMLWRQHNKFDEKAKPKDKRAVIDGVVSHLVYAFKDYSAPPLHDRTVNLQEIETILCKWKSHMNGHYPLNNDIVEIAKGLDDWCSVSTTAKLLRQTLPKAL